MIIKEKRIGDLEKYKNFRYKSVIWQKLPVHWNSFSIKQYLGDQYKSDKLVPLVKCMPKIGKSFQMAMSKFFNAETIIEEINE
jgi:hypothetical protein